MKIISRGTHGADCDKATHCSCGAPVETTPIAWKDGKPVEWRMTYTPPTPQDGANNKGSTNVKLIHTDNFNGDYPDEKFVTGLPNLSRASLDKIAKIINDSVGENYPRFWEVVDDDYQLRPGFEP